uniref:DUF1937 domain-containing protein n=1 Tax=viral metagenome TaxID=1070528 RepID=A0A6M3LBM4_9ZZZZ
MRIYVAHPYGRRACFSDDEIEKNVYESIRIGRELILKGHEPYIPNLFHFLHKGWGSSPNEDRYFHMVSHWIRFCDAFYYGGQSDGCDREKRIALSLRLPIYYSLEEVPYA